MLSVELLSSGESPIAVSNKKIIIIIIIKSSVVANKRKCYGQGAKN
jgi:hypothetical protein